MTFSDVIGQTAVKNQLVNMVQQQRLSHAQLFLAGEGTGGLPMALAFAQYIVCEKVNGISSVEAAGLFAPEVTEPASEIKLTDSCGTCPACVKAAAFSHPDIHFSFPIVPKKPGDKNICSDYMEEWRKFLHARPYGNSYDWLQFIEAENKQGNINVHECNSIIKKLSLKSFEAGYKILVMWMPELLGNEGNRLLKLIEEPPEDTLFVFVAENQERILQTILSRTQLVKFPPLATQDIEQALILQKQVQPTLAHHVAAMSQGNYHEALHMLENTDEDHELLLKNWLNAIITVHFGQQIKCIDAFQKLGREKQKQFFRFFIHVIQQANRLHYVQADINEHNAFAAKLVKLAGYGQLQAITSELDKATYYIERNANAKMLMHALTIKIYHILKHNVVTEVA